MERRVLAIDLGASSGRGIAFCYRDGKLSYEEIHRFPNGGVRTADGLHWDIESLYSNIMTCIAKTACKGYEIESVGIDTWGVDYGLISKSGKLKNAPFHYRDQRTEGIVERFDAMTKRELYDLAGISLNAFNTSYQLSEEVKTQSFDDVERLLFMPNLLGWMLTDQAASEPTIASTSGFYRRNGGWSKKFLDTIGVPERIMPHVVATGSKLGDLKASVVRACGLKKPVAVTLCPGHDTACAVLSIPSQSDRTLFLSSGTWSLFGTETDYPIVTDISYAENYTNEIGYGGNIRLLKNIMGLWIVQEVKKQAEKEGERIDFDEIVRACEKEQPFVSFIDVQDPLFNPPDDMIGRIRAYCARTGQTIPQNIGQVARCVYESLALEYRYAAEGLSLITGQTYDRLHVIGGGSKNRLLNQFTADALQTEVFAGPCEGSAIGNALAQLIAIGAIADKKQARLVVADSESIERYLPEDAQAWEEAFKRYKKIKNVTNR